eukprot:390956-Rhodomonas_salina.1
MRVELWDFNHTPHVVPGTPHTQVSTPRYHEISKKTAKCCPCQIPNQIKDDSYLAPMLGTKP